MAVWLWKRVPSASPSACPRMVVEIPEELEKASKEHGWTLSPDGVPMRVEVSDCTVEWILQMPFLRSIGRSEPL